MIFWKQFRYLLAAMLILNTPLISQTYTLSYLFDLDAESLRVVTDEHGHALVAFNSYPDNVIYSSYYSNNQWNALPIPGCPVGVVTGLAMHSDGTAVLVYIDDGTLRSLYFNGGIWTVPSIDRLDSGISNGGALAMNANGTAAVAWSDFDSYIIVNTFQNGAWGTPSNPVDIGIGSDPLIGININDDLVVGFLNGTAVDVSVSLGGTWNPNPAINADAALSGVGIDDNGNSIVLVRENPTGDVIAYNFLGGSFDTANTLTPGSPDPQFTQAPVLGVAPSGTAVAAWNYRDDSTPDYRLYYSAYNGSSWDPAIDFQISVDDPFTDPAISLNTNGDALIFFGNENTWDLFTSYLPVGNPMDAPLLVSIAEGAPSGLGVSLADNGFNALVWVEDEFFPIGMAVYVLAAPTGLQVRACYDRDSDDQTSCINYLSWDYSNNVNIASYNIFKDGVILANVPVNDPPAPQTYTDVGNICGQQVVYAVETVDQDGMPGMQASVTLN